MNTNMNTTKPTPETDAESINGAHHPQFGLSDFTRKLERKRDEAREHYVTSAFASKLERERDEAREQLEAMREAIKEAISALQTSTFVMQHSFPSPAHEGVCGPESCCDASCMEAASLVRILERNNAALAKLQPFIK